MEGKVCAVNRTLRDVARVGVRGWMHAFQTCGIAMLVVTIVLGTQGALALEDAHIKKIEEAVVKHICSEPAWVECWGERASSCERVMTPVTKTCLEQYLPAVKESVQYDQARIVGLKIITCLNNEFVATRPFGKKDSPECAQVPQHLQ